MQPSTKSSTPTELHVPNRVVFVAVGLISIVVLLVLASMVFLQSRTNQIQSISAYLTQCWVGTQSKENYVFIYNYFGTSTLTPSYTPLVAVLTKEAQQTPMPSQAVVLVATVTPTNASQIQADAKRGEVVFSDTGNCAACHDAKTGLAGVGPSLLNIGQISQARFPGIDPALYLKESIIVPNAYIVPSFSPDVMPKNYATNLTNLQINDLIAYLMALK